MNKNYEMAILAEFENSNALYKSAKFIAEKGFEKFDVYSPFPIHGMDQAMGLKNSKMGWIVLVGGIIGVCAGFGMQLFMSLDYKYILSGKPFASYAAFIPVTFEIMVLFSAFAAVFGMFAINKLPQHHHYLFQSEKFRKVTTDGFFMAIESQDKLYNNEKINSYLRELGAINIEVLYDE